VATPIRVFDCFGTVVFTGRRPDHRRMAVHFAEVVGCDEAAAKNFVYPILAHAWLPQAPSLDVAAHVRAASGTLGVAESRILDFLWHAVGPGDTEWVVPKSVPTVLAGLTCDGYELRLLTNCTLTPDQLDESLAQLGIRDLFSVVFASSSGHGKKPQPEWFREAFAGGSEDIAMVGDHAVFDIAPARALGIPTVHIRGPKDWDDPSPLIRPRKMTKETM